MNETLDAAADPDPDVEEEDVDEIDCLDDVGEYTDDVDSDALLTASIGSLFIF